MTLAWHFLRADGRLRDGRKAPRDGVALRHDGPAVPCTARGARQEIRDDQ